MSAQKKQVPTSSAFLPLNNDRKWTGILRVGFALFLQRNLSGKRKKVQQGLLWYFINNFVIE
jgi:hypothetical protein